jgi:hypothetical protein
LRSPFELVTVAGEDVTRSILTNSGRGVTVALGLASSIGGAAILICGSLTIPSPVQATPVFAGQTGQPCTRCHTSQTGGKELTDFGKEFKANGNKLKKQ